MRAEQQDGSDGTRSWTLFSRDEVVVAGSGSGRRSGRMRGPVSVPDGSAAQPDPRPAAGVSVRTEPNRTAQSSAPGADKRFL